MPRITSAGYAREEARVLALDPHAFIREAVHHRSPAVLTNSGTLRFPAIYLKWLTAHAEMFAHLMKPEMRVVRSTNKSLPISGNWNVPSYEQKIALEAQVWIKFWSVWTKGWTPPKNFSLAMVRNQLDVWASVRSERLVLTVDDLGPDENGLFQACRTQYRKVRQQLRKSA